MRGILLLTTILVTITLLPPPTVQTQEPDKDQFPKPHNPKEDEWPKPETYPQAGGNCKVKKRLQPGLVFPDVRPSPGPYRPAKSICFLSVANCKTRTLDKYRSGERDSGIVELNCTDYRDLEKYLLKIELCCDQDSSDVKCSPPTPWFDTSSGCKELQSPQVAISGGTAILELCGHPVFYETVGLDDLFNDAYRAAVRDHQQARGFAKVCCDKFNDAVRTGKPCDPRKDVDCDGQPNTSDRVENLPAIDASFTVPSGVSTDAFPPGMTPDEIMPPDQCKDCKWELIKGVLKCNPDPTKSHSYDATWKCPSTGAVVEVTKLSKPGARCPY